MKRVFSGIQPSGNLHIGNYLGAVRRWAPLQDEYDCIYCVVDLHALTVYQEPAILRQNILDTVATLLAAGIDPEKSIIFVQSYVKDHAELAWILNTVTPIAELERMTQFKEKAIKNKANINAGLFDYPVLMAADILLYNAEGVPVGEDQRQHVEISRIIARKFNNLYGETFKEPDSIIQKETARIMSLTDPEEKMSKSDKDQSSCIYLSDNAEQIREKIKKAVTDSGKEIIFRQDKPAISNLLTIYSSFSGVPIKEIENKYQNVSYSKFKEDLAEVVIEGLALFQEKYAEIDKNQDYVSEVINSGAKKAKELAESMMKDVRKKIGID